MVGAAIVRDGRVLAARRSHPPETAGRWEFPGGKVEDDETPEAALARELAEELSIRVEHRRWLSGSTPIRDGIELRVAVVDLVSGTPEPAEHDRLRWLGADELDQVDWLEPDRPFLPEVGRMLGAAAERPRAIFFDGDDAESVAARLRRDGFTATVLRERLAGEDDDEDHPWAVLSDAPEFVLDVITEEHDGWLDVPAPPPASRPAPLTLPTGPRRIKRPGNDG